MSSKTKIVIIGGSYSGIGLAQALLKSNLNVEIVIINPSDKFFFNIASPRILAKPKAFRADQYLIPIVDAFANSPSGSFEFIQGEAIGIDPTSKTVTVSTRDNVSYDYLVIASGSSTASSTGKGSTIAPFKPTGDNNLEASIKAAQQEFSIAKNVVIGGGGAVGVEFAGELAEVLKGKNARITLVSATWHVLSNLKKAASEKAETILAAKGVTLKRACKVVEARQDDVSKKWTVTLDDGQLIEADVYISTTGVVPNNQFIPPQFLDSKGWVDVDSEMRVKESSSIYAIGDITSHSARLLLKAQEQIPVLLSNLKNDILGQGKRKKYEADGKVLMIVPVGSSSGTGQMLGIVPWGKMVAMIKGKDFFVSKAREMIGLK
jgi:NADH dehydrogenase FAD-containing subunit